MAPKLILWDKVNTIPNWWEPLGPISGHFGPFRRDFRPQSKIAGPDWSLFLTRLAAKNDFNPFAAVGRFRDLFINMPLFFLKKLISGGFQMLGLVWIISN